MNIHNDWKELPSNLLNYLNQRNNYLTWVKSEQDVVELVSVLLILSDISTDSEKSHHFVKKAYDESASLPTLKYLHLGATCRLAIKEYENKNEPNFKKLVNETLESRSEWKDLPASLSSCATFLYWIYKKTGEFGSLAEDYCLKASLFGKEYDDLLVEIQDKFYDLADWEVCRKISNKNLLFGFKDCLKSKYIYLLEKMVMRKNLPYSEKQVEVKELLEELSLWQAKSSDDLTKVEYFILNNNQWQEKNVVELIHSHYNDLYTLNRLLDVYHLCGNELPPTFEFHLNYLYLKCLIRSITNGKELHVEDYRNLPYVSHFLASHYIEQQDSFMAVVILLEFKKLAQSLVEEEYLYKNDSIARANWYFFCIRALERVIELYPKHEQSRKWKDELAQLYITKGEIESTSEYDFDWEKEETFVQSI